MDKKLNGKKFRVALAGNPNVGKSTLFNDLTGLHAHTGNWPGKTVAAAEGFYTYDGDSYSLCDLPGAYSLCAISRDEQITDDALLSGEYDATAIICDATCLERNLTLALQIIETCPRVFVCVNLLDEAAKKGIDINLQRLSELLDVPVTGAAFSVGEGREQFLATAASVCRGEAKRPRVPINYPLLIERCIKLLDSAAAVQVSPRHTNSRALALRLLCGDEQCESEKINDALSRANALLKDSSADISAVRDGVSAAVAARAKEIAEECICCGETADSFDRKIDRLLTSRHLSLPIMLLALGGILYITITGANYPSELLSNLLFSLTEPIRGLCISAGFPTAVCSAIADGLWRTLAWVVSVMLPPMAIFFPLFTLLEDSGFLPRVAFNLDRFFSAAHAHGRQSLTMCMGLGCNACGVTGCRIIDSPRERKIAILTNNFVPCNGRFPTLIAILLIFFAGGGAFASLRAAGLLLGLMVLAVIMTFLASFFLSKTLLKGESSFFCMELPPYRKPQIIKVIVRSVLDRTLFVLGRAICVAAPAGIIIWLLANISIGSTPLLTSIAAALDPIGQLFSLDGMILLAFILAFPANEIAIPILLMGYLSAGQLTDFSSLSSLQGCLAANGWTWLTALNFMLLTLFHFPCGTTCLTIYSETKSIRQVMIAFLLPTVFGLGICLITTAVFSFII